MVPSDAHVRISPPMLSAITAILLLLKPNHQPLPAAALNGEEVKESELALEDITWTRKRRKQTKKRSLVSNSFVTRFRKDCHT